MSKHTSIIVVAVLFIDFFFLDNRVIFLNIFTRRCFHFVDLLSEEAGTFGAAVGYASRVHVPYLLPSALQTKTLMRTNQKGARRR